MVKHYIRLDKDKNIIKIFCTDFEKNETGDICILKNAPRHIGKTLEKGLMDSDGKYNYKYVNKKIVERTENEKWTQVEKDDREKEVLIATKMQIILRDQAIQSLKDENKLDVNSNLIK